MKETRPIEYLAAENTQEYVDLFHMLNSKPLSHFSIFKVSLVLLEFVILKVKMDRLCGLVIRVSGYRSRGPGFDSRPYQIFWEERGGLERAPLSLAKTIEQLLEWKSSCSDLENRD
jgi:hypothetical protein